MSGKSNGIYPQVISALIAFGFVFIHPFEDGNGRLHRFLIHDILVQDGIVPSGLIIPVSAHMPNNIEDYDGLLEKYSKPLMQRIRYDKKDDGSVTVTNPEEMEEYFRCPDKDINSMIIFLHQNKGVFPKKRREKFARPTDEEIQQMQQAYRTVYETQTSDDDYAANLLKT